MGSIYDQQNKVDQALKYYLEAIDMGEHNPAAVRRTVQLLYQKQRYADADKLLRKLDRQQVPFTPELTKLWVQLLIQQGEFDLAVAKARQTVSEKSERLQRTYYGSARYWESRRGAHKRKNAPKSIKTFWRRRKKTFAAPWN